MTLPVKDRVFASLDGQSRITGACVVPDLHQIEAACDTAGPSIGRGSGICFVGASFGAGVRTVAMRRLHRVLDFDVAHPRITVEAGATLAELYAAITRHGWQLPALPGYPQISIGGCIASNVHGKNPALDGTFVDWVECLDLFHPDHGVLHLSRTSHADLFELTCGGLGLTGLILRATLRLRALPQPFVAVRKRPVASLAETVAAMDSIAAEADCFYSWHNLTRFDAALGRGYLVHASFAARDQSQLRDPHHYPRHDPSARSRWMPCLFRPWLVPWIARWHEWSELRQRSGVMELYDFVFPGMGFRSGNYFEMYGRRGLIGHMVLVPRAAVREYLDAFERILRAHRVPILIAAMKRFAGRPRLIRFDGDGTSLHLHIANDAAGQRLAGALEELARAVGAPRALYVDSRVSREDARALYPEFEDFRARLHGFDPRRRFQSELSRRLDL